MSDFKSRFVGRQAFINRNGNIQDNSNETVLMKPEQTAPYQAALNRAKKGELRDL